MKIMLIEDSAEDAELIQKMLDDLGDNNVIKREDRLAWKHMRLLGISGLM
jgi:CheY-like chemotaxis protein